MVTVSRKQIENYYSEEWSHIVSMKTIDLLIELTCQAYHLNQPQASAFVKETPKPQNLGQV